MYYPSDMSKNLFFILQFSWNKLLYRGRFLLSSQHYHWAFKYLICLNLLVIFQKIKPNQSKSSMSLQSRTSEVFPLTFKTVQFMWLKNIPVKTPNDKEVCKPSWNFSLFQEKSDATKFILTRGDRIVWMN